MVPDRYHTEIGAPTGEFRLRWVWQWWRGWRLICEREHHTLSGLMNPYAQKTPGKTWLRCDPIEAGTHRTFTLQPLT